MTQHVSTNDTNFPRWIRSAAVAINAMIGDLLSVGDSITTLTANVGALTTDVGTLTTDVGTLNTEVAVLQAPTIIKFTPLASAPASPSEGWAYYDSTTHKLFVYDGTTWQACW